MAKASGVELKRTGHPWWIVTVGTLSLLVREQVKHLDCTRGHCCIVLGGSMMPLGMLNPAGRACEHRVPKGMDEARHCLWIFGTKPASGLSLCIVGSVAASLPGLLLNGFYLQSASERHTQYLKNKREPRPLLSLLHRRAGVRACADVKFRRNLGVRLTNRLLWCNRLPRSAAVASCHSCASSVPRTHWQLSLAFLSPGPSEVLEAPVLNPFPRVIFTQRAVFLAECSWRQGSDKKCKRFLSGGGDAWSLS